MDVNYQLIDDSETSTVKLRVLSIDEAFFAKILAEGGLSYASANSSYTINIHRSGTNRLESDMGATSLYVDENGFVEQEITLEGYVTADRNIYQDRVNNVMQMVNAAA